MSGVAKKKAGQAKAASRARVLRQKLNKVETELRRLNSDWEKLVVTIARMEGEAGPT